MKKLIAVLLIAAMMLPMAGCAMLQDVTAGLPEGKFKQIMEILLEEKQPAENETVQPPVMETAGGQSLPVFKTMTLELSNDPVRFGFTSPVREYTKACVNADGAFYIRDIPGIHDKGFFINVVTENAVGMWGAGPVSYSVKVSYSQWETLDNNIWVNYAKSEEQPWDYEYMELVEQSEDEVILNAGWNDGAKELIVIRPVEDGIMAMECGKSAMGIWNEPLEESTYNDLMNLANTLLNDHITLLPALPEEEYAALCPNELRILNSDFTVACEGSYICVYDSLSWTGKDSEGNIMWFMLDIPAVRNNYTGGSDNYKELYEAGADNPDEFMSALCNIPAVKDGDGYIVALPDDFYGRITMREPDEGEVWLLNPWVETVME